MMRMWSLCVFVLVQICVDTGWFAASTAVPSLDKRLRHFINLTNGIEAIPQLLSSGVNENELNYIRIQSTHCESRNYNAILEGLDTTLLMNLARGNVCLLYDFGSRGTGTLIGEDDEKYGIPRAYWMGTEWIRHALASIWHLPEARLGKRYVRGYNSVDHFNEQIMLIPKVLRRRIKYFRPYVTTKHLHLYPIYKRTMEDANKQFHVDTMASSTWIAKATAAEEQDAEVSLIDNYIEHTFIPRHVPGMGLYRGTDFVNIGRASK